MSDESSEDYHARMVAALTKTVFDTSLVEIDGRITACIRTTEVCEALLSVIGILMEGAPPCQTPQGMLKMSEAVGRNALASMKAARKVREENGRSILGIDSTLLN